MAAAVTLSFNSEELTKFLKRTEKLPTSLGNSLFDFSKVIVRNLRKNATTDPLRPITQERMSAAQLIRAKKLSKFRSVVSMPQSLVFLDSMKPHYVSLKRGRKITAWAKRNAGTTTVSGRSSVKRGSWWNNRIFICSTSPIRSKNIT